VQTFLPYASFQESAKELDSKRLNKQILECYQILKVLSSDDPKAAWRNHPAVKMWRGHEFALWNYVQAMIVEADIRGIKTDKNLSNLFELRQAKSDQWGSKNPDWMSDETLMKYVTTTHKANLFIKDQVLYPQFETAVTDEYNQPCCPDCKYFWVAHYYNQQKAVA
jgi:hypothetical protein